MTSMIQIEKLSISENNVRKSNAEDSIDELAANIAANGLIQNLQVTASKKKGHYQVFAGGRRLRAITQLVKNGTLPKKYEVACDVRDIDQEAQKDLSLSENTMRIAMTAADECKAFSEMIQSGKNEEDVAARYGCDLRHVRMRLRLGNLEPTIFEALRGGYISIESAKSYGLTGDHSQQLSAWTKLSEGGYQNNTNMIRRTILDDSIPSTNAAALYVGEKAYLAAGGRIEADLFAKEDQSQWLDPHIVEKLADEKMQQDAKKFRAQNGFGWIRYGLSTYVDYNETGKFQHYSLPKIELTEEEETECEQIKEQIQALYAALEEANDDNENDISSQIDTLEKKYSAIKDRRGPIPDEDKEFIGTFVHLNQNGELTSHHCLLSNKPLKSKSRNGDNATDNENDEKPVHSRKITELMAMARRDILALHIAQDSQLALDLVIFKMILAQLSYTDGHATGLTLAFRDKNDPLSHQAAPQTDAEKQRDVILSQLNADWYSASDLTGSFDRFREADPADKAAWLAYMMSSGLTASLNSDQFSNRFMNHIGNIIGINSAHHWRPTKENYFNGLRKDSIIKIIADLGDPTLAARYASSKKSEIAEAAEKIFAGTTLVDPEIKEAALSWVPEELRFETNGAGDKESPVPEQDEIESDEIQAETETA
ncbi:MAG: ParB/RepB/Spo0J family partition protein [Sphingomonadales bacterium]|nr:ParB/RepB/Spo0J family partition protein [Sphingomonadales bacterium]